MNQTTPCKPFLSARLWTGLALLLMLNGCSEKEEGAEQKVQTPPEYTQAPAAEAAPAALEPLSLTVEPATQFGIDFVHETGAAGKKLMPETMGPGCALFDYDGDERLDVLFTDGRAWTDSSSRPLARLYRNEGESFKEVTIEAGFAAVSANAVADGSPRSGYGMGVAAADYDADGDSDLAITTVGGTRLLRNDGGVYTDVTKQAGLEAAAPEWAMSPAWLDADGDGWLDLFVAYYVKWSPETDVFTTLDGTNKSYATPKVYEGLHNRLFRNLGDGHFSDVSESAGLVFGENKALGVVVMDVNDDHSPDVFVSNDTVANEIFVNDGKGVFSEEGMRIGVGYDEMGVARAGMGVDASESVDGAPAIVIGNFSDEAVSLYERTAGGKVFLDAARKRGIATFTLPRLTFGARFGDLNQDGRDDLILVNGHIEPRIQEVQSAVTYAQPMDVFLTREDGRLESLDTLTGKAFSEPIVGRCLALGDIDGDGDLDGLVSVNGGSSLILRNGTGGERAVLIDLRYPDTGNIEALGAEVVVSGKDWSRRETVRARGSYLGHSPYTLHFGIPRSAGDEIEVEVRWPDGTVEQRGKLRVGGHYRIERGGELTTNKQGEPDFEA